MASKDKGTWSQDSTHISALFDSDVTMIQSDLFVEEKPALIDHRDAHSASVESAAKRGRPGGKKETTGRGRWSCNGVNKGLVETEKALSQNLEQLLRARQRVFCRFCPPCYRWCFLLVCWRVCMCIMLQ